MNDGEAALVRPRSGVRHGLPRPVKRMLRKAPGEVKQRGRVWIGGV